MGSKQGTSAHQSPDASQFDESRVWYLLLNARADNSTIRPLNARPDNSTMESNAAEILRVANKTCKSIGVAVRHCWILYGNSQAELRYVFRFLPYRREDAKAQRLAESLVHLLPLLNGPVIAPSDDPAVLRIPAGFLGRSRRVPWERFVFLEEAGFFEEQMIYLIYGALQAFSEVRLEYLELAWRMAPIVYQHEGLFEALRLFHASCKEFCVAPRARGAILNAPPIAPRLASEQSSLENALQNAFKAIEAVLGDPPKSDPKLESKMRSLGLDPKKKVGYGVKVPLRDAIRRMSTARDKKAAHGNTKSRILTEREMLEFSSCAKHVLQQVLEHVLGEPLFDGV